MIARLNHINPTGCTYFISNGCQLSTSHNDQSIGSQEYDIIVPDPLHVESGIPTKLVCAYSCVDGSPKLLTFSDAGKEYLIYLKLDLDKESAEAVHLVHYETLICDTGGKEAIVMQPYNHSLAQVPYYPEHIVFKGIQSIK